MTSFNKSSIKHLVFDLGVVLYDIDYQAPIIAFEKLGISQFDQHFSKATQSTLFAKLERGELGLTDLTVELNKTFSLNLNEQEVEQAWNTILVDIPEQRIDMLLELKHRYHISLLSNTNNIHIKSFEAHMASKGLLDKFQAAFDHIFYSSVVGLRKPEPAIFKHVEDATGFSPAETWFIDDTQEHVLSAQTLGWNTYWLKQGEETIDIVREIGF